MRIWLLFLWAAMYAAAAPDAPVQPIPFSHKQHADAGHLKCGDCHSLSRSGEIERFPKPQTCTACHSTVDKDDPDIRALKAYAEQGRPIPWVRVCELPGFVFFSHKIHAEGGATCQTCHGPVETRDRLWRETDLSMQSCIACHTAKQAPVSCGSCHDIQQ